MALVRELHPDFGPTFACEKLHERHGLRVSRETLPHRLMAAGIRTSRDARRAAPHQPRSRRECLAELVQIDGCKHDSFEGRGPVCTLLVYVDDATGQLMELRFVEVESAFDYFAATATEGRQE